MSRQAAEGGVSRGVVAAAITGTFTLALAAFWLSFEALRDLARLAGIPTGQAWLWPLIVDGVILQATISVVALREAEQAARRFAWILLAAGSGVSVAANITHALLTADARVPGLVAALVASIPPLVLVAMTHLTVELLRNTTTRPPTQGLGHSPRTSAAVLVPPALTQAHDGDLEAGSDAAPTQPDSAVEDTSDGPETGGGLTREQRQQEAARLAGQQVTNREIARRLGVHPTTISRWLAAPGQPRERSHDDHDT